MAYSSFRCVCGAGYSAVNAPLSFEMNEEPTVAQTTVPMIQQLPGKLRTVQLNARSAHFQHHQTPSYLLELEHKDIACGSQSRVLLEGAGVDGRGLLGCPKRA